MKYSRQMTRTCLEKGSEDVRLAALLLVKDYWDPSDYFVQPCITIALNDPGPAIRGVAWFVLCRLQEWIDDPTGVLDELKGTCQQELMPPAASTHLEELRARCEAMIRQYEDDQRKRWERLAGSHLPGLLANRAIAETSMTHADSSLREAALGIIEFHWKHTKETVALCENLVFQDSDSIVRGCALLSLIRYYSETDDARVGEVLARIVKDENAEGRLRELAYYGLFVVRGMPALARPTPNIRHHRFVPGGDVDWAFVDTFLGKSPQMGPGPHSRPPADG
jgi:hypothetical protein